MERQNNEKISWRAVAEGNVRLRNVKHEEAAQLVSEDRLTDDQIAEKAGVTRKCLHQWKRRKAFAARVEELTAIWTERALRYGLAKRERRLAVLSDMHNRLLTVIDERAQAEEMQTVPGGKTGLVCKSLKGIGKGSDFQVVEVYEADTGILKELRGLQEQIAKELGQAVEHVSVTVGLAEVIEEARKRVEGSRVLPLENITIATDSVN
jgi:hypothetical protein